MPKIQENFENPTHSNPKVETGSKKRIHVLIGKFSSNIIWGIIAAIIAFILIDSPKEVALKKENADLLAEYNILNKELDKLSNVIVELEKRDDNIYRVIFEAEPIDKAIRHAGSGGSGRYATLKGLTNSDILIKTNQKLDKLTKAAYIQSKSYDEVEDMLKNKISMLASIPAILPVSLKNNKVRKTSGFGYRIHPIYKTNKFHAGIDFAGPIGTAIYATGNGRIAFAGNNAGFGKNIIIDHGYSYKTVYAHMSAFTVKKGQKVKRGDIIGFIGNTGRTSGPHCHYEVHKNNIPVNPINYFFNDLTPDEYEELVSVASEAGQSMD